MAAVSIVPLVLDYFGEDTVRSQILPKTKEVYKTNGGDVKIVLAVLACISKILNKMEKMVIIDEVLPILFDVKLNDVNVLIRVLGGLMGSLPYHELVSKNSFCRRCHMWHSYQCYHSAFGAVYNVHFRNLSHDDGGQTLWSYDQHACDEGLAALDPSNGQHAAPVWRLRVCASSAPGNVWSDWQVRISWLQEWRCEESWGGVGGWGQRTPGRKCMLIEGLQSNPEPWKRFWCQIHLSGGECDFTFQAPAQQIEAGRRPEASRVAAPSTPALHPWRVSS